MLQALRGAGSLLAASPHRVVLRCVSALGALATIALQGCVGGSGSGSDSGSESGGHEASSMLLPTPPVPTPQPGGRSRVAAAGWGL